MMTTLKPDTMTDKPGWVVERQCCPNCNKYWVSVFHKWMPDEHKRKCEYCGGKSILEAAIRGKFNV